MAARCSGSAAASRCSARVIADPDGIEADAGAEVEGLGLLDARTDFAAGKPSGFRPARPWACPRPGYEIHHGRVTVGDGAAEFLGGARAGNVFGTMWHGSLEGDELRGAFLAATLGREPSPVNFAVARERRFDLLGDLIERHLDVDALLALARARHTSRAARSCPRRRMRLLVLGGRMEADSGQFRLPPGLTPPARAASAATATAPRPTRRARRAARRMSCGSGERPPPMMARCSTRLP